MDISMNVSDESGRELYHLTFSSNDFNVGTKLNIYRQDDKKQRGITKMKKVTVTKNGGIVLNIPVTDENIGYQLLNDKEAKAINKTILS